MKKVVAFIIPAIFLAHMSLAGRLFDCSGITCIVDMGKYQETHLWFKDGKVFKVENGEPKELQKEIQLNNGTVVYPDGTYELKDKRRFVLSEGECLDMNGSHFLNQRMLSQKRPMSADELQKSRSQNGDKGAKGKDRQ